MEHSIIDDLLASLPDDRTSVRSVLVGAHGTAVCSRHCGLATTMMGDKPHDHTTVVRDAGLLHLRSVRDLAEYARSENLLEASIGLAALNSIVDINENYAVEINAVDVLMKKGAGKNVALVGHFPFIPHLRKSVGKLWVIEQHPTEDDHPSQDAGDLIPRAEVVGLTGSTLINHTLDGLLELCQPEALVVLLGPTTPLSPVLFDHGVDIVAGSKVVDEEAVLYAIGQGATFQQVKGVRLLTLTHKDFLSSGRG
jgi:uncharacterized protein (DUF4213/DUF364 family)